MPRLHNERHQEERVATKADWQDRIAIDPAVQGGKPVVKGTRVPVQVIVGALAGGMTVAEACEEYRSPKPTFGRR